MSEPTESLVVREERLWKRRPRLFFTVLTLSIALIAITWILLDKEEKREVFNGLPHAYTFRETESSGKVALHMMSLSPDRVVLRPAGVPLRQIAAYGINGGFFYGKDLLSIAIMNDNPVSGGRHDYGSGWFNAKYARGTLVWDGAKRQFSVQVVSSGDELAVSDRNHYFAQGGISMNLEHEEQWAVTAQNENLPYANEQRMRSGMVYDKAGALWLIVTPTLCTAEAFRAAILESVPGEGREGIFLDGDGSSQMNADEAVLTGDQRAVVQMIAVSRE
ncbi:hypothetical protein ACFRAM_23685 [Paenibacillus sp. NPDC056722]|uniref:hypothetical protein n=1 Tax=Paenibacillus sp. NPDC056722 TaxID=3345924 RepID=UPI0036A441D4